MTGLYSWTVIFNSRSSAPIALALYLVITSPALLCPQPGCHNILAPGAPVCPVLNCEWMTEGRPLLKSREDQMMTFECPKDDQYCVVFLQENYSLP